MPDRPLAYFISFTCYGTWLHGRETGSVDRHHNEPGSAFLPANDDRKLAIREAMRHPPYFMDQPRRRIVLAAILEVCSYRDWQPLAIHVRSNHLHAIVQAEISPERVMADFKAYSSRALNRSGLDRAKTERWTRHGSTLYVWTEVRLAGAIHYVLEEQGEPMERYSMEISRVRQSEPRPLGSGEASAP